MRLRSGQSLSTDALDKSGENSACYDAAKRPRTSKPWSRSKSTQRVTLRPAVQTRSPYPRTISEPVALATARSLSSLVVSRAASRNPGIGLSVCHTHTVAP